MKKLLLKLAVAFLLIIGFNNKLDAQVNAIYAGGAIHDFNQPISNVDELRSSGYNTVIVWTIHILADGSLNLNFVNDLIDGNGNYIGDSRIIDRIRRLKQAPTNINRIEFGVGSASGQQFNIIRDYYQRDGGFPPGSPIYESFKTLRETFPFVDAINNDDEVTYDVPSAVAFTKMLASLGFKNAIVPYRNASSYWGPLVQQVNQAYPGNMDRNYLQCYAGGSGNNPCQSQWNFGIPVIGGLWGGATRSSTSSVQTTMTNWKNSCNNGGGFMWVYDDFVNTDPVNFGNDPTFSAVGYANAINNAFSSSNGGSNTTNIAAGKPFVASSIWSTGFEGWRSNDTDRNTRWASSPTGTNQAHWVYYDLQGFYNISSVQLYFESAISRDFNIQIWNGSAWVNQTGLTNNNNLSPGLGLNTTARYIRFISWRHQYNHVSLWEFEVYGTFSTSAKQGNGKNTAPPEVLQLPQAAENKEVKVFPNPAINTFNINLNGFKNAYITVSDLLGKIVYTASTSKNKLKLSKGSIFKSGMYIIRVTDENNEQYISKLVVK